MKKCFIVIFFAAVVSLLLAWPRNVYAGLGYYIAYTQPMLNSGSLVEGSTVTFKSLIMNTQDIPETYNGGFYIDLNNDSSDDIILTSTPASISLNPGETAEIISGSWTNIPKGVHKVMTFFDLKGARKGSQEQIIFVAPLTPDFTISGSVSYSPDGIDPAVTITSTSSHLPFYVYKIHGLGGSIIENIPSYQPVLWIHFITPNDIHKYIGYYTNSETGQIFWSNVIELSGLGRIAVVVNHNGVLGWLGLLNINLSGPGVNFSGNLSDTLYGGVVVKQASAGTYTLTYLSGGPPGASYKGISHLGFGNFTLDEPDYEKRPLPNPDIITDTMIISSPVFLKYNTGHMAGTFTIFFESKGQIAVNATLDGAPWTGAVNYTLLGPETINGDSALASFADKFTGLYTLSYNSGGPAGASLDSITPISSQTLVVDSSIGFTMNFKSPHKLSVTKAGVGFGTVTSAPAGLDCGAICSADFSYNTLVSLTAAPAPNDGFAGWSGDCSGRDACTITMEAAKSVTATFVSPPNPPVNLSAPNWSCGS